MADNWTNKWNERYSSDEYAYGKSPNEYLEQQLKKINPGNILFPAEGEGRNAVFAATLGWNVAAFDISSEGKSKAIRLAAAHDVTIDYRIGELATLNYSAEQFDAIALIYAHFPAVIKSSIHKSLDQYLKVNGVVIFEAFSKKHLDYIARDEKVGGPKDVESLFSIEEVKADFPNYTFSELIEMEIDLSEGLFHNGKGSVIRFVAVKKANLR
ncbi:MAG: class I SAM-dependent methyltransferase [Chitinophagaceae bacterium]